MGEPAIQLEDAKICIECEMIFTTEHCPRCGDRSTWQWLSIWVRTLMGDPVDRVLHIIAP